MGRADNQVKLRGHRIELGEIENVTAGHPAVSRAVAVVAGARLAVAVVPAGDSVDADDLLGYLSSQLPPHMVPGRIITLDELPLSANGKLDRARIAAKVTPANHDSGAVPAGPVEEALARLWCTILELPTVTSDASFFALGGHSLLAGRLLARALAAYGIEISLPAFLDDPTLGGMAAAVTAASCSQAAVQTAINAAQEGDAVMIPAGTCSWTQAVSVPAKALTIQGAGRDLTIIVDASSAATALLIVT